MRIYDGIMLEVDLKKEILIEFGFGEVSPIEVEKYIRNKYPMRYKTIKIGVTRINEVYKSNNLVIPFKTETMTREQRNATLDNFMNKY